MCVSLLPPMLKRSHHFFIDGQRLIITLHIFKPLDQTHFSPLMALHKEIVIFKLIRKKKL